MELADLRTLMAVVEHGSITRAAEALNRVPSGVTARVLQLEESLGARLFLREKKRLLVTPKGRALYDYACRIAALVDEAEQRVRGMEPGGKFRIGALESTAAARLPQVLARLHAACPRIEMELAIGASRFLYEDILENRLDAAFIVDAPTDERLERVPAFAERLVLVAPGGHAPIRGPRDVAATVLAFPGACAYRNRLLAWFRADGREPRRVVELASYNAIMGGVMAGMGVGVVPASVLDLFPGNGGLSVHELRHDLADAVTELVWRRGMNSANVEALRRFLDCSVST